jgi:hypothetical protein
MDHDFCWHSVGQAQVVRGGHAVDEHSVLVTPPDSVDDGSRIWRVGFLGQLVETELVVEPAVNPPQVFGVGQPLQRLVDGVSRSEIDEIGRRPDLAWRICRMRSRIAILRSDESSVMSEKCITFSDEAQNYLSEICIQISDDPLTGQIIRATAGRRSLHGWQSGQASHLTVQPTRFQLFHSRASLRTAAASILLVHSTNWSVYRSLIGGISFSTPSSLYICT